MGTGGADGPAGKDAAVLSPVRRIEDTVDVRMQVACQNIDLLSCGLCIEQLRVHLPAARDARGKTAHAVVEGAGDHCCEYMTGGVVVVLGETGRNFGAGMTGGIAYVLDQSGDFLSNLNPDGGKLVNKLSPNDEEKLLSLIRDHHELTGSKKALRILENWEHYKELFIQIVPPSEAESVTLVDAESAEDATREVPLRAVSNTA